MKRSWEKPIFCAISKMRHRRWSLDKVKRGQKMMK
jgi:hypothetical protein